MNRVLWVLQGVLALLFLFAGGVKLLMPPDELAAQAGLPAPLLVFVSVAEVLGGLGLVLPGLLRIRPGLTPLAAAGLTVIMLGATVIGAFSGDAVATVFPLVTGLLTALVAYGRSRPTRQRARVAEPALDASA